MDLNDKFQEILNDLYFLDKNKAEKVDKVEFLKFLFGKIDDSPSNKIIQALNMLVKIEARFTKGCSALKRAETEKEHMENSIKALRNFIKLTMEAENLRYVKGDLLKVTYSDGKESLFIDESLLPNKFKKRVFEIKPDTKLIQHTISEGLPVEGVKIVKKPYVTITPSNKKAIEEIDKINKNTLV